MESIDKLREYGHDCCARIDDAIHDLADEIEREVEYKMDDLMATSVDGYPEPFNTPDAMHMVLGTAADCFDTPQEAVHYLRGETSMLLPLDVDGVPIRIGDTVREVDDRVPMKVMSLTFYEDCVDVNSCGMNPNLLRHVKPRTIEDVLTDFAEKWMDTADANALLAKYADELRNMGVGE